MTIDLATARHARIYTSWGTVVYFDAASGELRHGPIETNPENAVFVADPTSNETCRQGWLMQVDGEKLESIACGPLGCRSVSAADPGDPPVAATLLDLIPLERGLIAFGAEGHFLGAQPDGRLDVSKPWCSTWELFLASEDWCSAQLAGIQGHSSAVAGSPFNWCGIADFIIDARLRAKVNANSEATKILIYGYPAWSHGRVYYDLCKELHKAGYIVDIINWQVNHAYYMNQLVSYYDLFISALDGMRNLLEVYRVPPEKVIGLSHHEMDIQILIDQMGRGVFERLAGYGVASYPLFDASAIFGVPRHPLVVPLGVNFDEFCAEIPQRLATVGYAGSYSHKTRDGLEWKRGELAEAAAREAGLEFKIAGSTANQISFHDMPEFYRSVDAVLVSSLTEGAGLPAREAAAAGRLVISTPVGDFPMLASKGTGIIAPIEAHKYKDFVAATLKHYKESPDEFVRICRKAQDAARQLDWSVMIGDWIELIDTAKAHVLDQACSHQQAGMEQGRGENILLRRTMALGDVLETTPIAHRLRLTFPAATIYVETEDRFAHAYAGNPDVDHVGIPPGTQFSRVFELDDVYERNLGIHRIDAYMEAAFGDSGDGHDKSIVFRLGNNPLKLNFSRVVALHPNVSSRNRTLPQEWWGELARRLIGDGWTALELGTHVDHDLTKFGVIDTRDQLTLAQAAAVIAASRVLICGDSSMFHLVGCTDTPAVGFCTVDKLEHIMPFRHGELGWNFTAIAANVPCCGCREDNGPDDPHWSCRYGHFDCVRSFDVDKVFNAVLDAIRNDCSLRHW